MAHELRLALLEEEPSGSIKGNVEALDRLGGEPPSDLRSGAERLLGASREDAHP